MNWPIKCMAAFEIVPYGTNLKQETLLTFPGNPSMVTCSSVSERMEGGKILR